MKNYYIKAEINVYEDNYEQGEGSHVNCWHNNTIVKGENPMAAAKNFFDKILRFSFDESNAVIDLEVEENVLQYSTIIDEENYEVENNSKEFEEFKEGKKKLFSATSRLEIFELVPAAL